MLTIAEEGGAAAPDAVAPRLTLGAYLAEAGKALRTSLPRAWVEAVVLEARAARSGISLELVEPMADARQNGRLKCFLPGRTIAGIEERHGLRLDDQTLKGLHLVLLIETRFSKQYHLQGEVIAIDPAIVVSMVEKALAAFRALLQTQGLYEAQRGLASPDDVTSLAVVHPDRSAGWADVQAELERLAARGILRVQSCPTPFEGAGSTERIAEIVRSIGDQEERPDLILIVRGGGAAAGLASLADPALVRSVCRCPVPVVTGLGHASDRSLLDEVAWRTTDTPSKAPGLVKTILARRWRASTSDHRVILEAMERVVGSLHPALEDALTRLTDVAERALARQGARLHELRHETERHGITFRGRVDLSQAELERLVGTLVEVAPRVPRVAARTLLGLHGDVARATRARLPDDAALRSQLQRSSGLVAAAIDRQEAQLRAAHSLAVTSLRARLAEASAVLAATHAAAQALDVTATLARGFTLALDPSGRVLRSSTAAQTAARFELLFADGRVACRPASL